MGKCLSVKNIVKITALIMGLVVAYWTSRVNYLLFHAVAEFFSIVIAFTIFVIIYNSRKYIKNNYLLILGMAYFFIGALDFLHTPGFKGMGIFKDYDYYANQLWVAARLFESLILLVAVMSLRWKKTIKVETLFGIMLLIQALVIYTIFPTDIFPEAFVEGVGQTTFKIVSEYIIIAVLFIAAYLYRKRSSLFGKETYRQLMVSILLTILGEMCFTFYNDNYGLLNMFGHIFKVFSFYFIYRAVIVKVIMEPYDTIFKELTALKDQLDTQNVLLKQRVNIDGLTGIFNHCFMLERIEKLINLHKDRQLVFSAVFLDIDNFKEVNDQHGHLVGDLVLIQFADILKGLCRQEDFVGRIGGDEFLMLLVNSDSDMALMIAERLEESIRKSVFADIIKITVSIGVIQ